MYYVHDKATKNCAAGINQKQCSINIVDMVFTITLKGVLRQGRNVISCHYIGKLIQVKTFIFYKTTSYRVKT